jgi:hypothetical protein
MERTITKRIVDHTMNFGKACLLIFIRAFPLQDTIKDVSAAVAPLMHDVVGLCLYIFPSSSHSVLNAKDCGPSLLFPILAILELIFCPTTAWYHAKQPHPPFQQTLCGYGQAIIVPMWWGFRQGGKLLAVELKSLEPLSTLHLITKYCVVEHDV